MARTASTIRLYSRKSSPTSEILMSSAVHSRKRGLGGDTLIATGEASREDTGVSNLVVVSVVGGTSREVRRDVGGDS